MTSTKFDVEIRTAEGIGEMHGNYASIGQCIYCGAKDNLGREHIIPFALSGSAVLPNASCQRCAAITGKFEQEVLRGPMWAVRSLRKLRSRTRHTDAPATERVQVVRGGVCETIELPIKQCPLILTFPTFALPRVLTGRVGTGIEVAGFDSVLFGRQPEDVLRDLGGESITFGSGDYQYVSFARMLAKIGYAMAIAQGEVRLLDGLSPVLPAILGERDDIGQWVGTIAGPNRKYPGLLHRIELARSADLGLLMAQIQLFADSESPSYIVVLGNLRAA